MKTSLKLSDSPGWAGKVCPGRLVGFGLGCGGFRV